MTTNDAKASERREFFVDALAGWVAGASSTVCVQPVDTILTRVQSASIPRRQHSSGGEWVTTTTTTSAAATTGTTATTTTTTTTTTRNVLRSVFRDGGCKAFFRGLPAATMVIPLQNMLLFVGYGAGERWMEKNKNSNNDNTATSSSSGSVESLMPVFVGGVCGGIVQSFVVAPFELLKVNQQVQGGSAAAVAERLLRRNGGARHHHHALAAAAAVAFR